MILLVFLALLNGCCISFCRIINGRLAQDSNAFYASFWNHFIGFIFLSIIVYLTSTMPISTIMNAHFSLWFGGVIGALFVALNSYVLSKMGATLTAILVIGGQLLTGIAIDFIYQGTDFLQLLGVFFILISILFSKRGQSVISKETS